MRNDLRGTDLGADKIGVVAGCGLAIRVVIVGIVAAGDSFAFGRAGSGGFPGVTPIGGDLFGAGGHGGVLYQKDMQPHFGGDRWRFCEGGGGSGFDLRLLQMTMK